MLALFFWLTLAIFGQGSLELPRVGTETRDGVTIEDLTFLSPSGARTEAYLVRPQLCAKESNGAVQGLDSLRFISGDGVFRRGGGIFPVAALPRQFLGDVVVRAP